MKFRRSPRQVFGRSVRPATTLGAVALATGAILSPAAAATQTLEVSGNWDTTSPIWNGATAWTNGNDAVFAGTATTIEIAGDIQVSGISSALDVTFNDSVPGGTITFLTPATLSGGGDLTFNTLVSGSAGLTIDNVGGIVALNAENSTLTGPVSVLNGTLQIGSDGAINAINSLAISTGAAVTTSNINQIGNVAVTNAGTLSLGGNDNVLSYASNGGTFNGPGTLTSANGYALNTGTTVNGNLGNGVITANGTVALNGNTGAGALAVQTGTTTVGGNLGATTVAVTNGATLATTASGNLADTAAVNLNTSGALQLGASDTIGRLSGAGGTVDLGANTLTLANGASATSGAVISGTGGIALSSGTQTLSGVSNYSGATNVNGGTLALTGTLTGTTVNVASGAALTSTGGLADGTNLSLTGSAAVTLTAAETLASLSGAGTVSATDLTVGALNGTSTVTSSGTVTAGSGNFSGDLVTGNLVKNTAGTLTIDNDLTTAGSVNVAAGTLVLAHATDTLNDASALTVQSGATVSLSGTDTVASLVSNGGTLSGTGTLTAATYALNDGTTIDANLGTGTLTANGIVALNGDSAASTFTVQSGVTTLAGDASAATVNVTGGTLDIAATGALTGATTLGISAGATVTTSSNDQLANTAAVNNQGVLSVNGTDTVASFTNTGTLSGSGTLTTTDGLYTLATGSNIQGNLGAGTVNVTGATDFSGTSAASAVNINAGSLTLDGDNLDNAAVVTNSASLVVNGSDTVGSVVNTGTISGAGILTASTYTLAAGSVIDGHLGLGTVDVTGATTVNGQIDALAVNVADGITLELSGDNLADASTLTLGTGGTITLFGNETVGTFVNNAGSLDGFGILTAADYILNNGTTVTAGLGNGNITTNGTVSIQGATGAGVFTVATGTTTLASFTGATSVNVAADSSLLLGANAEINAATTANVATGATLTTGGVNQIGNATVTNAGTLNLGGTDAVAAYVSNAGTFNGPGTLTAATYALNNGTVVNGNLGAGAYTANGTVLIQGTTGAGSFLVQSGQTTHNNTASSTALSVTGGQLVLGSAASFNAATTIDISGPGTLTLGNSNQLGDTAALVSAGTVDLGDHSDSVASFVSNGGTLSGTGTLTAATYALNDGTVTDANLGTGTLTANGTVAINGNTAASTVTVQTGTTTLAGASSATTVQVDNAAALVTTASGTLADNAAVTLTGTAALTLGQSDTIANLSGAGTVALGANTLTLSDGAGASSAAVISGTGGVTLTSGTQTLSGASTYAGATNVNGGTLALTGSLLGTEVNVASGAALTTTGGLADATDLTLTGTASATFTAAETLDSLSGAGSVTATDLTVTTLTGTAAIASSGVVTISEGVFDGVISSGSVVKTSPGSLTFTATQGYVGGTTVNGGTLVLAHATDTLADTGALTALTGTTVDIQGNTDTVASATLGGSLIGTGTLTATTYALTNGAVIDANLGTGTLTANGTVAINGNTAASAFTVQTGTTTLAGASSATTVQVDNAAALVTTATGTLADNAAVTLTGTAALTLGQSDTIANLSGAGTVSLGENRLNLSNGAGASSAAVISGTGGVTLTAGTQTLSGASTYTGDTVVNGGNLIVDGSNQSAALFVNSTGLLTLNATSAAATVDIATGGTLTTGAAERLNNNVIVENDGTLNLGGDETLGALFGAGVVNLGTSNLTFAGDGDVNPGELTSDFSGSIIGSGTLTKNGDDIQVLSGANTYSGIAFINDGVLRVTNSQALGLAGANGRTNVFPGGTLQLANNISLPESIRLSGLGFDDLGTINNLSGANTITGQIGVVGGQPETLIRASAGSLTLTGDILRSVYTVGDLVAAVPRLTFQTDGASTIALTGSNALFYLSNITDIAKTGTGTLDLSNVIANQSTGNLFIDEGTVLIALEARLGGSQVIFGDTDAGILRVVSTATQTAITPGAGQLVTCGDGTFADFRNTIFDFAAGDGTLFTEADTAIRLSGLVNFTDSTLIKDGAADLLIDLRGGGDAKVLPSLTANNGTIHFIAEETAFLAIDGLGDGGPGLGLINFGALDAVITQDFSSTFTGDLTGTADLTINTVTGSDLLVSGVLSGFSSVSVGGDGTGAVEFSAANTYTGPTNVLGGGDLSVSGTLQTSAVNVAANGSFTLLASDRLLDTATVTNAGTFDVGTHTDTVASFTSNGGTLAGTGTLTAATYALNNGTLINANLGAGALIANGTVAINGNTGTGSFTVQSGTTTLAGTSSAATVQIDSGAALTTTATGELLDSATVTLGATGTLNLGQAETIGRLSGAGTVNLAAHTLTLSNGLGASSAAVITGTGGVTLTSGTQTLSGASTYTGATNVNGGTLALTGSLTGTEVNVASGAALTTTGGLADATDLTLTGTASATFTAAETLDTLNGAGTVSATDLTVTTVTSSATINSSGLVTISDGAFSGNLVTGALTKVSAGTLTLSGENATSGPITVNGGTLALAHATNTLADTATLTANAGTTVDIGANTDTVAAFTSNGATFAGTGTLTAATYALNNGTTIDANLGAGALTANGTVAINGNTGTGSFVVQTGTTTLAGASSAATVQIDTAGTLVTTSAERLSDLATVTLDGAGVLTLGGNDTIGRLAGNGGTVNLGATTLTLSDGQGASSAAVITGTGGVTLSTGTQTLSGASTYTGATNVNGGTLALTGSLTGTEVNVASGAALTTTGGLADATDLTLTGTASATFTAAETLDTLNGAGTVVATDLTVTTVTSSATINSSGLVTISDGAFSGNLATGALTKVSAGTLTLSGENATSGPITVNGGTLALAHATNTLADTATLTANAGTTVDIGANTDTVAAFTSNGATFAGTGTLTAATYALNNGTTIDANLGAGALTANGTVAINGNTGTGSFVVQTGTTTLAGASSAATVQIDTAGTLVTTATGTLDDSATVIIDGAGVLTLGQSDTIGRLAGTGGTVNLGATTLTLADGQGASSAAVITGTGGVTLTSGTQTLSGASTYTGATNVNGGTLALTGSLTGTEVNVASGAALTTTGGLADATDLTLTGTASATFTAAETLDTLNGAGTVSATDLTVTTVTSSATINSSGLVTISDGAFSGNLVTGALTKVTAGTLTLSGENATPGPIIVDGGTLVLAHATNTLADTADLIANTGTVVDIQGNTDTIGTLTVNDADLNGTGRLTATTYALNDGAIVRANLGDGTATVNGEVRALSTLGVGALELTIANGGVLRGLAEDELPGGNRSFTIDGNLTVANGGRLAPGASPGITVLTGDWTHNGTFEAELAGLAGAGVAGGHDQIQVGGVITLGATSVLDIRRDGVFTEPARGDLFRIITGDLADQKFATVVTQFSTGLVLDLEDGTLIGTGLPVLNAAGAVDLTALPGLDANTIAIVGAFQAQAFSADANGVQMNSADNPLIGTPAAQGIRALLTTPLGAGNGIQAASPESFAGESAYALRATRHYADTALHAPALAHAGEVSLFAAYSGHSAQTDSSIAAGDFELTGSGAIAGARASVGDSVVLGLFAAFDEGDISARHRSADVSGVVVGLTGEAAVGERTTLTASIAHGDYESDSSRASLFAGQRARARGIDSDALHLSVGLRHDLVKEKDRGFSPYLEFRYTDASTGAFAEAAPTFDRLAVEGIDYTSFEGELGARGYIMVTEKFGFHGQLAVAQEFGDDSTDVHARLANGGQRFTVRSEGFGETAVTAGAGFSYDATDRLRLGAGVKAGLVTDADTTLNYHVGGSFRF